MVTQHAHPGDGAQRPLVVWGLQHLVLLGVDVEMLRVRADLYLGRPGPVTSVLTPSTAW